MKYKIEKNNRWFFLTVEPSMMHGISHAYLHNFKGVLKEYRPVPTHQIPSLLKRSEARGYSVQPL